MIISFRKPSLAFFVATLMMFYIVAPASAGMIQSQFSPLHEGSSVRSLDVDTIQRTLETKIVQEKLNAYGLSDSDVRERLQYMTDGEIHLLAQASERVLEGGDGVTFGISFAIGVLIVVLLVIMILKLLNKEIIIR